MLGETTSSWYMQTTSDKAFLQKSWKILFANFYKIGRPAKNFIDQLKKHTIVSVDEMKNNTSANDQNRVRQKKFLIRWCKRA